MPFSDWEGVNSSNLEAVRYDPDSGILQVRFQHGSSVYEWYSVEKGDYEGLLQAPSPGRYLNGNIHALYGLGIRVS